MARMIDAGKLTEELDGFPYVKHAIDSLIEQQPTVDAVPVVRCKECKHFELNHFDMVDGMPIITAHEICTKWGDGCKTAVDGYCFMAERKEE